MSATKIKKYHDIVSKVVDETKSWARKEQGGVTYEFLHEVIQTILDYVCRMSGVSNEEVLKENPHLFDYVIDLLKGPRSVISKKDIGISLLSDEIVEELHDNVEEYERLEKQEFYMWQSLCEHLIFDKGYDKEEIIGEENDDDLTLDRLTDKLVTLLALGSTKRRKKRKGLLMSDVQSGKTLKYTALSAKAIDLATKIVIIIAGATSFVRDQTQERQEYGVIGLTTDRKMLERMKKTNGRITPIGSGKYLRDKRPFVKPITTMDDGKRNGDLTPENLSKSYETGNEPLVFVVKSTKTNLEALLDFLKTNILDSFGNPSGNKLPALIVHDECDHSSLNTNGGKRKSKRKKEEDGPSTCNRLIREVVDFFDDCGYLAVSATPFANVLINPFCPTVQEFKPELFTEDFILYSKPRKKYISQFDFFGLPLEGGSAEPLPLTEITNKIDQFDEESITSKAFYKNRKFATEGRPKSLEEAIDLFILTGGLRLCRELDVALLRELGLDKWSNPHSMLIHISESISQQKEIHKLVVEYIDEKKAEIKSGKKEFYKRCKIIWKQVKEKTKRVQELEMKENGSENPHYKVDYTFPQLWKKIVAFLDDFHTKEEKDATTGDVIHEVNIRILNSDSKETISYQKYLDTHRKPLKVIVIGANVIARGASLEGLCVTYYTRDSVVYDTTIQSGRFFGYYDDWKDLIRVYLTKQSYDIFWKATYTIRSLIQQIEEMNEQGKTPMDFGIRMEMLCDDLYKGEKITNKGTKNAYRYSKDQLDIGKEIATFYANDEILKQNLMHIQSALTQMVNNPKQKVYEDQFQVWIQDVQLEVIKNLMDGLRICAHSRLKSIPTVLKVMEEHRKGFDVIIPKLLTNESQDGDTFEFGTGENTRKTYLSKRCSLDIRQDGVGTYFQPRSGRVFTTRHLTYGLEPSILALLQAENEGENASERRIDQLKAQIAKQMEMGTLKHDMIYREVDVLSKRERGVIYFYPLEIEPINNKLEELGYSERISVSPIGLYIAFPGQAQAREKESLYLGNTIDRLINYFGDHVIEGGKVC
ncbi:Z1 domain-containing protein [Psychrobacillus sp. NPDC093180]|uniref:Z1 domain-containing protein n=1 Tax=Psychrobacillus sp. NPDC093180 TaxID=3364489 RepID=UPI0037F89D10